MKLKTSKFGEIEINNENIISFPGGIYGFEKEKEFALINSGQKNFFWLQSLKTANLSFLLTEPSWFMPQYSQLLEREFLIYKFMPERYMIFLTAYFKKESKKIFSNIGAPIIIDKINRLGTQIILKFSEMGYNIDILEYIKGKEKIKC